MYIDCSKLRKLLADKKMKKKFSGYGRLGQFQGFRAIIKPEYQYGRVREDMFVYAVRYI